MPGMVAPPGYLVRVQLPEGSPDDITVPPGLEQFGSVIVPTAGVPGTDGWGLMAAGEDAADRQPPEVVTVNVYVVAGARPVTV